MDRDSENKLHFDEREDKYEVFKNPQVSVLQVASSFNEKNVNVSLHRFTQRPGSLYMTVNFTIRDTDMLFCDSKIKIVGVNTENNKSHAGLRGLNLKLHVQ